MGSGCVPLKHRCTTKTFSGQHSLIATTDLLSSARALSWMASEEGLRCNSMGTWNRGGDWHIVPYAAFTEQRASNGWHVRVSHPQMANTAHRLLLTRRNVRWRKTQLSHGRRFVAQYKFIQQQH